MASYASPSSRAPVATTSSTTPFPSRPFLHSLSPSSSNQQTPPELRKLEVLWRELRRTHLSPPVKDKGKGREQQLEEDEENRSWQHEEEGSDEEDDDEGEGKVQGEFTGGIRGQSLGVGGVGSGIRDEGGTLQLRPPRFRSSAIPPPTPRASSSANPQASTPQRVPSTSSAYLSDVGTHWTTSFTVKPSPPLPPPQPVKPRSTSPPLAGPSRTRMTLLQPPSPSTSTRRLPSPAPRVISPHPQQPSPSASPPPNRHLASSTPFSPLYTAHLPSSYQPFKHGYISINSPSGVRLVLRGRRWELSGDGETLSYWPSLTSHHASSPPLQRFTSPFDALLSPPSGRRSSLHHEDEALLNLHRKRLSFLRSYFADVRSESVFCSIPLPSLSSPSSSQQPLQLLLQIHANPPHPSLTLLSRCSSSPSSTRKIIVRWISQGTDASGRWDISLVPDDQAHQRRMRTEGEGEREREKEKSLLLDEARRCWEVLDGLRRGGLGERVWRGWVEGTTSKGLAERANVG